MSLTLVHKEKVSKIRPILWYGQPVILQYRKVFSILEDRISPDIVDIFLVPDIESDALKGTLPIKWFSDRYRNLRPYYDFDKKQQQKIERLFEESVVKIEMLIDDLRESEDEDEQELADFLANILEIPKIDYIFFDGKNIALAFWSFKSVQTKYKDFSIRKVIQSSTPKKEKSDEVKESIDTPPLLPIEDKKNSKIWLIILLLLMVFGAIGYCYYNRCNFNEEFKEVIYKNDSLRTSVVSGGLKLVLKEGVEISEFEKKIKNSYPNIEIVEKNEIIGVVIVKVPNEEIELFEEKLSKERDIISVSKERIFSSSYIPNDTGFQGQKKKWGFEAIKAFKAWDTTRGKKSILIAIIDVGFDTNHPELQENIRITRDIVGDSTISTSFIAKNVEHGTHVSSIVAGVADNSLGVSGVCPNCSLLPIQVGSSKTALIREGSVIKAILYAVDHGADIINISLGSKFNLDFSKLSKQKKQTIREIYKQSTIAEEIIWKRVYRYARKKNIVVLVAGGNDNMYSDIDPMNRSSDAISVGAVDSNIKRAKYSNYGSNIKISAPGSHVYSAMPNGDFAYMSGTSMATPFVAGAVGLVKSLNPNLTPMEIRDLLVESGKKIDTASETQIGRLIQLDKLVELARDRDEAYSELKRCREKDNNSRKFVIPSKPKDFKFAKGLWKSSSAIQDLTNNRPIELYFNLEDNGRGKIEIHQENGDICSAYLELSFDRHILAITQKGNAVCEKSNEAFSPYKFSCESNNNREAICKANGNNQFSFRLKRVD